jgi:hypothetical protein
VSKYKALSTLGLGLMQYGANKEKQALEAEKLRNDQIRNERLDALAERKVVNEEAMTAANVRKADLEAIKMGIENENLDAALKADIRAKIAQGDLAGAQALLAGANTRGQNIANDLDTQFGEAERTVRLQGAAAEVTGREIGNESAALDLQLDREHKPAERALGVAGAAADVTGKEIANDTAAIKLKLLDTYGEEQMQLELDQLFFGNEKTKADIAKGKTETLLKEREQKFKEFVAGADYDEEAGTYKFNGKPLSTGTEKLPTSALQLADRYLLGYQEEALEEAIVLAQADGKITPEMSEEEILKVALTGKDSKGLPYMPSPNELMFKAVDYAVQQMGRANYGAMQFQGVMEGAPEEATGGLMRSPYQRESLFD